MKFVLLALFTALVAATPLPGADAGSNAVPECHPFPGCVEPIPGKCDIIMCIRAPCFNNCCGDRQSHCPKGFSCYGTPSKCCPPGWWCDGEWRAAENALTAAPGGPRNCHTQKC
ncbi:hypothetical protein CspeluHIS016_0109050 [Cutaneotrichosporon spelunceum]|uniref:Uncharacterized protein n=1 Tax=Cutaneotrichosporon spelunceum TaxID=1672016 RepID=A0AAD3TPK6_9TREE|nr:hypothetical protein CspeluHIS016_0109050 [Cutaneotrichosporon spelunceum]